ncbi:hypothetical protein pdam_00022422, partial [Pocillopora damicornis]
MKIGQSAREKEQLTQKIIHLETQINAKEKEIGFLEQTPFGNDKDIADLKEKLSQLKQTVQTTQSDFVKHMASINKKLQEARKNIAQLEGDLNFTVQKSKTEAEESNEKLQEAKKNIAELEGGLNFTVKKNKTEAEESWSKPQTVNGKDYFDHHPSWFDTLSKNAECLEVENVP